MEEVNEERRQKRVEVDSARVAASKVRERRVVSSRVGFRMVERDMDLLQFLHEQQFASIAMLYFRFFDRREKACDPLPENLWVTRQRLSVLRKAGLVTTQRVFTEGKSLYLLSQTGYEILRQRREFALDAAPPSEIDFRYYEHDKRVSLCRVALERSGKAYRWYPDRLLRRLRGYPYGDQGFVKFPVGMIPDGVFVSARGERVAFELELTPKKRERYQEKRDAYRTLLPERAREGSVEPSLHRAIFVACTDRIGKDLVEFYGASDRIRVIQYESLVAGTLGKEALTS